MAEHDRAYSDVHHQAGSSNKVNGKKNSGKRPLFGNLVWTRESEEQKEQLASSLLSRIEKTPPPQASLLERISPVKQEEMRVDLTGGGSDLADAEEHIPTTIDGGSLGNVSQPSNSDLADMFIASALAEATHLASMTNDEPEQKPRIAQSAVSSSLPNSNTNHAKDSSQPITSSSGTRSSSEESVPTQAELVAQAKQLLVPIITQNARLRDPDADVEVIKARVMSMITDEQCLDFLKLAKDVRDQMRSGGDAAPPLAGGDTSSLGTTQIHNRSPISMPLTQEHGNSGNQSSEGPGLDRPRVPSLTEDPVQLKTVTGVGEAISTEASLQTGSNPRARSNTPTPTTTMPVTRTHSANPAPALPVPRIHSVEAKSPPRAPRAMRQSLGRSNSLYSPYPNPSAPSLPAALRLASSRHGDASQPRRSASASVDTPATTLPSVDDKMGEESEHKSPSPAVEIKTQSAVQDTTANEVTKIEREDADEQLLMIIDQSGETVLEASLVEMGGDDDPPAVQVQVVEPSTMVVDAPVKEPESVSTTVTLDPVLELPIIESNAEVPVTLPSSEETMDVDVPALAIDTTDAQPIPAGTVTPTDNAAVQDLPMAAMNVSTDVPNPTPAPNSPVSPATQDGAESEIAVEETLKPSIESIPLQLPNLLRVIPGSGAPGVTEISFEVEDDLAVAAHRWGARQTSYDPAATQASVFLLCLPAAQARTAHETTEISDSSGAEYTNALWDIRTRWPPQGKLMVQINSGTSKHVTFVPHQMGPRDGPLDITAHVQPGTNTVQLIHLADSSAYLFAILARTPPAPELKWQSLVTSYTPPRSKPSIASGSSKPTLSIAVC